MCSNLLSNYKHKKSTEEWLREKVTKYETDILEHTMRFLETQDYFTFEPDNETVILHDKEKAVNAGKLLKESPKLLKQ